MSGIRLLTPRQIRSLEKLPEGYEVVSSRYGEAIVRGPDGVLLRMHSDGQLSPTIRVERVQAYLHVHG